MFNLFVTLHKLFENKRFVHSVTHPSFVKISEISLRVLYISMMEVDVVTWALLTCV